MDLIFKTSAAETANSIVGDSNFKDHYPAVNRNMKWATLKPYIRQAIRKFILPWVGRELYNDLADKFIAGATLDDNQAEALELLQDAAAHYTIYHALPKLNIAVADMGVQQNNDREGTSTPPSQWAFKTARWDTMKEGDQSLDLLMQFLESMVADEEAYFDLYKNSEAYSTDVGELIRSTDQLNEYINIQGARRAFVTLVKYVKLAEQRHIQPLLGSDMYNELRDQVADPASLTEENSTLLAMVRRCLANWALYEAIPHTTLLVEGDGLKVASSSDGFDDKKNLTNLNHSRAIESLRATAEQTASSMQYDILKFLYANEDDYLTWKNSDAYAEVTTENRILESNDQTGAIFL